MINQEEALGLATTILLAHMRKPGAYAEIVARGAIRLVIPESDAQPRAVDSTVSGSKLFELQRAGYLVETSRVDDDGGVVRRFVAKTEDVAPAPVASGAGSAPRRSYREGRPRRERPRRI